MRRQGGGFGMVIMMVILAVVFYLAMHNFKSVAPTAMDIQKHNRDRARRDVEPEAVDANSAPTSASGDAWNPTPPSKPSLSNMDQNTSKHASDVSDAMSQSN